jgi:hypothetical protein
LACLAEGSIGGSKPGAPADDIVCVSMLLFCAAGGAELTTVSGSLLLPADGAAAAVLGEMIGTDCRMTGAAGGTNGVAGGIAGAVGVTTGALGVRMGAFGATTGVLGEAAVGGITATAGLAGVFAGVAGVLQVTPSAARSRADNLQGSVAGAAEAGLVLVVVVVAVVRVVCVGRATVAAVIGPGAVLDVVAGDLQLTPCAICSRADSLHGSVAAAGGIVVAIAEPGANDEGAMPAVEPSAAGAAVGAPRRTSAESAGSATSSAIIAVSAVHGNRARSICMGECILFPQVSRIDHVLLLP